MNEDLQSTAKKIQQAHANNQESVSLDQPHPDQLNMPTPTEPAPEPPKPEPENPSPKKSEEDGKPTQMLEPETKQDDKPPTFAGFKPEDLLVAPLRPPEPVKVESRSATTKSSVRLLIALGVILVIIGIILMLVSWFLAGFIVALIGAVAVVASVFLPLKH